MRSWQTESNAAVLRETAVERIDYIVSVGKTVLSPLLTTEHAVSGVIGRRRDRRALPFRYRGSREAPEVV